jgi:hypothetical protein
MKFGEGKDRLIAAVTRSLGSRSSTIGTAYSHAPHRRSLFSGAPDAEFVDAPCERTRFADRYLAVSKSPAGPLRLAAVVPCNGSPDLSARFSAYQAALRSE